MQTIDYTTLPFYGPPPSREHMNKTAELIREIHTTWKGCDIELGTVYMDEQLCVRVGVPKKEIKRVQALLDEQYRDRGVRIVVNEASLHRVIPGYLEIRKSRWRLC